MCAQQPSVRQIGKYLVLDVIGAGGMGIVYRAQDPAIGRTVAIKMLRPREGDGPLGVFDRFFLREMKSTGNLHHKNIVTVYDSGEQDGVPYLVMEYLEGEPVSKIISEHKPISLLDKLDVIVQVCDGLQYAHDRNIIHRDVKPANVILLADGTAKLVDFGVARIAGSDSSLVQTGHIVGSLSYMSPEQINSLPIDGRSDIFSTGVMFYELLTYEVPFKGSDPSSTFVRILREEPLPLSRFIPDAPSTLQTVISRALAKNVHERYQSAEEFGFDLLGILRDLKAATVADSLKRAESAMQRGDLERVRALLQEVLRLDRHNDRANRLLREVRQNIQQQQRSSQVSQIRSQAQVALAGGQYEEALACADQALRLDPTDTDSIQLCEQIRDAISRAKAVREALNRAETALFAGDFDEAKDAVEESLRLNPSDSEARALASMINKELAERSRRNQVQGFVDQARRGIAERKFTDAIDALHRAEELDPTDSNVRELLQWAQRGQEQENKRRYLHDITDQIENALHGGDFSSACTISEMGLQRFPEDPTLLRLRAISEKQRGIAERRRFVHDQSLAVKALTDEDKLLDAVQVLTDALRRYPGEPNLESLLAITKAAIERQQIEREEAARKKAIQRAEAEARAQSTQQVLNWSIELRRALDARTALADILKSSKELRFVLEARQVDDHARDVASLVLNELNARIRARDQAIIDLEQLQRSFERPLDSSFLSEVESRLLSAKAAFPNESHVQRICSELADSISRAREERNRSISLLGELAQTVETTPTSELISLQEKARKFAAGVVSDPRAGALLQQIDSSINRRFERRGELLRDMTALLASLSRVQSLDEITRISDRASAIADLDSTDDELAERSRQLLAEAQTVRDSMESLLRDMAALARRVASAVTIHDAEQIVPQVRELAERRSDFQNLQEAATRVYAEVQGRRIEHDLIVQELEATRAAVPLVENDEELDAAAKRARECLELHPSDPTILTLSCQIVDHVETTIRERTELRARHLECDNALGISKERLHHRDLDGALEILLSLEEQNPDRVDLHVQISILRKAINQRRAEQERLEQEQHARDQAEAEARAGRAAIEQAIQRARELLDRGLADESAQCLRSALEREPGHEELEAALQSTLAEISKRREEQERLERERIAREKAEAEVRARREVAELAIAEARELLARGRPEESVQWLRSALQQDPKNRELQEALDSTQAEIARQRAAQERLGRESARQEQIERERVEADARARRVAAEQAIERARKLFARGKTEESLGCLRDAIQRDPQNAELGSEIQSVEAELERQRAELQRLERERAERERLAREQAKAEARVRREAVEQAIREARELFASGREDESIQRVRSGLELYPRDPELSSTLESIQREIARERAERERLERERLERERLAKEKAEAEARARQAEAERAIKDARRLLSQGQEQASLQSIQTALEQDPENSNLRSELQSVQEEIARRREERERLERERLERGRIAREKAEAEARARQVAAELAIKQARQLLSQSRSDESLQRLRSALQQDPQNPELGNALDSTQTEIARLRAEQERLERERLERERLERERIAQEKAEAEARARQEAAEGAIKEARELLALSRREESLQRLRSALQQDPQNPELRNALDSTQTEIARLRAEQERLERERLERERLERERIAQEKAEAEARARREAAELAIKEAREFLAQSRSDESLLRLRSALQQDPQNSDLRKVLDSAEAEIARRRGEQERLERERIAREKAEAEARARREAAELAIKEAGELLSQSRNDHSLQRLRSALQLDPRNPELQKALDSTQAEIARQRAERERLERERLERERLERERISREKAEAEARARREAAEVAIKEARQLLAQSRSDESLQRLRSALQQDPQNPDLRRALDSTQVEIARQRAEQERLERERLEHERLERERIAREKAEAETRARREAADLAIKEAQRLHAEGRTEESVQLLASASERDPASAKLKAVLQTMKAEVARQHAEKERLEREQRERERIAKEKAEAEERARLAAADQALQKARKLLAKGSGTESLHCLRSALQRDPENKDLRSALESTQAEVDRQRAERERLERERLAKEEAALRARDLEIEQAVQQARKLQSEGKTEEALKSLRTASKRYPDSQELRSALQSVKAEIARQRSNAPQREKRSEPQPKATKVAEPETDAIANAPETAKRRRLVFIGIAAGAVLALATTVFLVSRTISVAKTQITFTLDPPDATLKVDGSPAACAGTCVLSLSSKDHNVVAEKPGFNSATVVAGPRSDKAFILRLDPLTSAASSSLSIVAEAAMAASVSLDGRQVGDLSTQRLELSKLAPGSHNIAIPGNNGTLELTVEVSPQGAVQVDGVRGLDQNPVVAMTQNGDRQEIFCRCDGAEIRIDGKNVEPTVGNRYIVPGKGASEHEVTLLRNGQSKRIPLLGTDAKYGMVFVASSGTNPPTVPPDAQTWQALKDSRDLNALRNFRAQYPQSPYARIAYLRCADLTWESIRNSAQTSPFQEYLSAYPDTLHAQEARDRITALTSNSPLPVVHPPPSIPADLAAWNNIKNTRDLNVLKNFRAQYPSSPYATQAHVQMAELEWSRIHESPQQADLEAFLKEYPGTPHASEATETIKLLEKKVQDEHDLDEARKRQEQARRDRESILRALDTYRSAYETKDFNALVAIWPNVPRSFKQQLSASDKISVTLTHQDPQINGETATVLCKQKLELVASGKTSQFEQTRLFTLRRVQDRWIIEKDN